MSTGASDAPRAGAAGHDDPGATPPDRRRARWPWLMALPVALALLPVLYNRRDPELLGIPFFYWAQIALVLLCGACAAVVYRATRTTADDPPR